MKICFISSHAYSLFNPLSQVVFGGSELQLYLLSTELAKDPDWQVSFIVKDHNSKRREKIKGVDVYQVKTGFPFHLRIVNGLIFAARLWRLLSKVGPDAVVMRAAGVELGLAAIYCRIFGRQLVYMSASDIDVNGTYIKSHRVEGWLYKFGLKNTDLILVQNENHRRVLKETHQLDSIVFKNVFPARKPPSLEDKRTILWVSTSQPLKRPELFLQLARRTPKEKFVLLMPRHPNHSGYFEKIKSEAAAINNIELIPGVPFEKSDEFYRNAKVFVNTSDYEGFPNTFVQATAAATPILSLRVNPDGFLEKEGVGFCANGSFETMAEQLRLLLEDKKNWEAKARAAHHYFNLNHGLSRGAERLKKLLKSSGSEE